MKTIIAEKPSVARELARIVGATKREEGYFQGGGYAVTWAFGHLVQLAMPDNYGIRGFVRDSLPILPETFTLIPRQVRTEKGYKPDSGVAAQIKVIAGLFKESEQIIVATDAGREGELIFRYLYHYIGCTTPFVRLWISSLTDKAIREGLRNLEEGSKYDNLYLAAKARSESDWLVGINGTQALSIAAGRGTYSVGRVQTPTLAMVCERYYENNRFTPETFFGLHFTTDGCGAGETVKFSSAEKWKEKGVATELYNKVKAAGSAGIVKVERKEKTEDTPRLYDLTSIQKDANTRHGFTAEQTLDIVQKLYEKKLVTYPRTGSRYIPEDVFAEIPKLLAFAGSLPEWAGKVSGGTKPTRRSVDDGKVTDHHALLVTGEKPLFLCQRRRDNLPHDSRAHDRGIFREMRQGCDHGYGRVRRRGVHGKRLYHQASRMACRMQGCRKDRKGGAGNGNGTARLERGRYIGGQGFLHHGRQDQAEAPAHRSHPARGDGDRRQEHRGRGTAPGIEGLRYRHTRHPRLHHRDTLCP